MSRYMCWWLWSEAKKEARYYTKAFLTQGSMWALILAHSSSLFFAQYVGDTYIFLPIDLGSGQHGKSFWVSHSYPSWPIGQVFSFSLHEDYVVFFLLLLSLPLVHADIFSSTSFSAKNYCPVALLFGSLRTKVSGRSSFFTGQQLHPHWVPTYLLVTTNTCWHGCH